MNCPPNKEYDFNYDGSCKRIDYCCSECGCMVTTKFVYIYKNIYLLENRASVCVDGMVFWSNKTVTKKIVEYRV